MPATPRMGGRDTNEPWASGMDGYPARVPVQTEAGLKVIYTQSADLATGLGPPRKLPPTAMSAQVESVLAREPTTGAVHGFLALLDDAFRADRDRAPASLDELIAAAPRVVPLVAASEGVQRTWREAVDEGTSERVRIAADRAWLDDAAQSPYVARVAAALAEIEREAPAGSRIELTGGLVLADRFVSQLRGVGFTDFEVIPIEQLDLMSATLKKEPRRASVAPDGPPRP